MSLINIKDKDVQIFVSSPYHTINVLKESKIKNSVLFLTTIYNNPCETFNLVSSLNDEFSKIVVLANTIEEKQYFDSKIECDVLYCNKNCFINENIFKISENPVKIYDLVINSQFSEIKNVNLARLCKNTAHIGYYTNTNSNYVFPKFGTYLNFLNAPYDKKISYDFNRKLHNYLSAGQINNIINQSKVGGIFSYVEGQCRASSEYLL